MRIYIKDVYDEEYGESILAVPKLPDDILLSCKIAFSELYSSFTNTDDEYIFVGVWRCNGIDELTKFLDANKFEFELR